MHLHAERLADLGPLTFKVSLDNMWYTISSGVLGFSFIFGNTLSQQLQTILLIFVVHPFDVGDALLLDGSFVTVEQTSLNKARRTLAPRRSPSLYPYGVYVRL